MEHRETPFGHVLVLERGEELIRGLIEFARHEEVDSAVLYGIGAVDRVELGYYRRSAQDYERRTFFEELEVCTLVGNLSLLDGEPLPHLHGTFGRADFSTLGGHIFEAVCSITLEVAVHVIPTPLVREPTDLRHLQRLRLET